MAEVTAKWLRLGADVLGWVATAAGAAGIALYFSTSSARPLVLAASGAPYLMAGAFVGLVVFAVRRRGIGVLVAAAVATAAVWTQAPLHVGTEAREDGPVVTVMQANILYDGGADPDAVVARVRDLDVDLLTVNELTPVAVDALAEAELDDLLPHRYVVPGSLAAGTGIWSRHPLSETVEYDGFVFRQISAIAEIPGAGPVAVYAFHPVPPVFGTEVWATELAHLKDILDNSPADIPAVVGGDFNATYGHSQYRALLSGRFGDAAEQVGAGTVRTFPADRPGPPLVAIDHILVADGTALTLDSVDLPGADHLAVVARVRLSSDR
ncbi:endonuclease/exonuclease/phosphatase family protein [Rhodococcus sp. CH91]|uniref:endonuclease/exonuclease/phosphatase family protein n=1 Tax=Rhodococcus sp. CH91 TaxID=2910256 RepID=UPI001F4B6443|nr:endonuclease/exonuclease/phosphatase family protein [Rhodococcus sp. CH91]